MDAPEGGGGIARVIEEGAVFERGGVNLSHVTGERLPPSATASRPGISGRAWEAMGVSLVLHPRNPYAPTVHMNVRMFVAHAACELRRRDAWWFGGGMDLTPYYGFEEDAVHFHRSCRDALAPFGADVYARYKRWCDEYFYLSIAASRAASAGSFSTISPMEASSAASRSTQKRRRPFPRCVRSDPRAPQGASPYGERERDFQAYRRGRYVEFNLVFDRGTLFGLQSNGRTEAILMSLPPLVKWRYDWKPAPGTPEARLYSDFLVAKDWLE